MQVKFFDSIERIGREQWNQVAGTNYPFTRYEFLHALEVSGATDRESGWQPHHLVVYESNSDQPIALMPLYLKYHSYGEYVFDWSWADAYAQHNVEYYPKFVNAILTRLVKSVDWGHPENDVFMDTQVKRHSV